MRQARGILDFPELFPTGRRGAGPSAGPEHHPTVRPGALLAASRSIAGRLGMPRALPAGVFADFRLLEAAPGLPRGTVEVFTCSSRGAEADQIAEILRAAHLRDGLAWTEMAVLVRSGRTMIPGLTRALVAAGVPVEVAGDEIPLAADPAARPLLLGPAGRRPGRAAFSRPRRRRSCSTRHWVGWTAWGVRRLGRTLRDAERLRSSAARRYLGPPLS